MAATPNGVKRVSIVGAGVIGGGWAMHFLRMGADVVVHDPAPGAEDRLRRQVEETWGSLELLGLREGAAPERLSFRDSVEDAVADATFVQESSPEILDRKIELFRRMDAAAPDDVVLSSSTSGLTCSAMQSQCARPERVAVGHPFNPPYIMPIVEVVGGDRTDASTLARAAEFYERHDKHPIVLDVETPGFVATRLQEALWREMLHMLAAGEATAEQIDAAVMYGPGPRWAFMGPVLIAHLGGGPGGMPYVLDHFGPTLKEPWSRLEGPELTAELRERMVEGAERLAAGRSFEELVKKRDLTLIEVMRTIQRVWGPAGEAQAQ